MEILIVLGFLAGICGLSSMTKEGAESLEKVFSEMTVVIAFLASIMMLILCCFAIWILIDERAAVTFIFQGAVTESIFVGEYMFLKWVIFLPLPFAIPWIISRIMYVWNHMEDKNNELT